MRDSFTDVRKVALGCARSGSKRAFVARKSEDLKAMNGFCITRVMDVLSVFTFSYLKCLHSWRSISNFRKIFVAEGNLSPFTFIHQAWDAFSFDLIVWTLIERTKNYHTWQRSLAVHFISSFINHKWNLVCYSFSNSIAPNITGV